MGVLQVDWANDMLMTHPDLGPCKDMWPHWFVSAKVLLPCSRKVLVCHVRRACCSIQARSRFMFFSSFQDEKWIEADIDSTLNLLVAPVPADSGLHCRVPPSCPTKYIAKARSSPCSRSSPRSSTQN